MRTTDDPISLLCDMLRDGDLRTTALAYGTHRKPSFTALVQVGLLVRDGVVETTICDACDTHHLVDVVSGGPDGRYGWRCPEVGFVTADGHAVAAFVLEMERVVAALRTVLTTTFGAPRWRARRLIGTDTWVVGVWQLNGLSTTVALARGLAATSEARRSARALAELTRTDAGLVLTVDEDTSLEAPYRFALMPLSASLMLSSDGHLSVASDTLARAVEPLAAEAAHSGRPSDERGVFAVLDGLKARGIASDRLNAPAVKRAWVEFHPGDDPPSAPTVRRHVRTWKLPDRD